MSGPSIWRWGDPLGPLAALLARGGVLAVPTESSYALAADPWNPEGVAAVYRIKRREAGKPLPVVAAGLGQLAGLGIDPDLPILAVLAHAAWPGPLTAVLPLTRPLTPAPAAAAGRLSLAVRVPAHSRLRTLLAELGGGLTATSANLSGGAPARQPGAVSALLAGEDAVLVDDGPLPGGPPSTIVRWTPEGLEILRRGSFPEARLAALLAAATGGTGEAKKSNLPSVVGTYVDGGVVGNLPVPRKTEEEP